MLARHRWAAGLRPRSGVFAVPLEPCHTLVNILVGRSRAGVVPARPERSIMQVHGSCCAWNGLAVLLRGAPGSGKSDLALRLIDAGFSLVADDRVELAVSDGAVTASAPPALAGLIEVRGLGVFALAAAAPARLGLVADLATGGETERLPEPTCEDVLGVSLPAIRLDPAAPSAVARVRLALDVLAGRAASRYGALGDSPCPSR